MVEGAAGGGVTTAWLINIVLADPLPPATGVDIVPSAAQSPELAEISFGCWSEPCDVSRQL